MIGTGASAGAFFISQSPPRVRHGGGRRRLLLVMRLLQVRRCGDGQCRGDDDEQQQEERHRHSRWCASRHRREGRKKQVIRQTVRGESNARRSNVDGRVWVRETCG